MGSFEAPLPCSELIHIDSMLKFLFHTVTLKSVINVALRLLILTNFSHAYALIKEPTFINVNVHFMCFNDPLRTYGA